MLKVSGITRSFGGRTVLAGVSFVVNNGECAGLVGPSGAGKTTLLRIITGEERPDWGSVETAVGARLGYLRQGYADQRGRTVGTVFPALFTASEREDEVARLAQRLAETRNPAEAVSLEAAYEQALDRLSTAAAHEVVERAWTGLGMRPVRAEEQIDRLSGGEQTKLGLLNLVATAPDILLLDEPANNLDIAGLDWLDGYLADFPGPVLLVSHDRAVLDDQATLILELDPSTGGVEPFPGNYTAYAAEKARRRAELWQAWQRQQKHIREVEAAIGAAKGKAQQIENTTIHFHWRKRALKVARRAVTLQRRLQRELASEEHIDKPVRLVHRVRAGIAEGERAGARMVACEGVSLSAGGRELLRDADLTIGWGERVVLTGPNGSGKTTLLRAMLGRHPPAGGRVLTGPSTKIGYLPQRAESEGADLSFGRTPLEVIRRAAPLPEGEARRFLHRFLFTSDQVFTPLEQLSYGERRRLDLARLVVAGANLLILDEPTNHLDLGAREAFESALDDFDGALLVVSHDRYLIERLADRVMGIEGGRLVLLGMRSGVEAR